MVSCEQSTKRALTPTEIDDIVYSIQHNEAIPSCVSETHVSSIRGRVRDQLSRVKVYPKVIPALKAQIVSQYEKSRLAPGESVGIVTAQSIGERQTQMTLDTFHSAGAALKTVITGVPRFSELLSATKNPKSVAATVYPTETFTTVAEIRNSLGSKLKRVCVSDVVECFAPGTDTPGWYTAFEMINGNAHAQFNTYITLTFDIGKLYTCKIELSDIAARISNVYTDLICVYSPTFIGRIDVYIDTVNIETGSVTEYIEGVVQPNIEALVVSGITDVTDVYYEKNDNGMWYIETSGSNLREILNFEGVDKVNTVSNNVWEIIETLGVEAAREFLINEFSATISSDGTYVNKCHITLLVDTMTHGGSVMSVSRYGQRTLTCGPLAKASFEESMDNFVNAGVTGEIESTKSVSASIMLGKLPSCGTGIFDVHVDVSKLGIVDDAPDEQVFVDDDVYEF